MKSVVRFCVSKPITVLMTWFAIIIFGIIGLKNAKITLLPEIVFPRISVITSYPNASPEEIENLITKPLTDSIGTVGGIEKVTSESLEGISIITVQFSFYKSVDFAMIELREKIDLIRDQLPQDASKPIATRFDPAQSAFQEIIIFPKNESDSKSLKSFIEENVKVFLERIEGMAYVQISGGFEKEVRVEIDPERMTTYGVSIPEVQKSIVSANINVPAGSLPVGNKDLLLRTVGEYKSLEDIKETIISTNNTGIPIPIGSVASVYRSYRERTGLARYNGKDCIVLYLYKESGRNSVELADRVTKELESINTTFADKLSAQLVYDESVFIRDSVWGLVWSLILGALLAFLILMLLIQSFRAPLILLIIIPASLLATFLLFYIFHISLNMMSLGGLALGIGMLFDTSNVVFSSIERNLTKRKSVLESSIEGTSEVAGSILSATLTTIIVFLPIIFIKSFIGILFSEMAIAIVLSISISLFASVTIIPTLYVLFENTNFDSKLIDHPIFVKSANLYQTALVTYEKKLIEYLERPKKLFSILLIGVFFSSIFLFILPREFMPTVDNGEFTINIENAPNSTLNSTTGIAEAIEKILLSNKDIKSVISKIGSDNDDFIAKVNGNSGTNIAKIRVILVSNPKHTTTEIIEEVRKRISFTEDIRINFDANGDIIGKILDPNGSRLNLEIHGEDLKTLSTIGKNLIDKLKKEQVATDLRNSLETKKNEYVIEFDPIKASSLKLTNDYISQYVKVASYGSNISKIKYQEDDLNIRLLIKRDSIDNLNKLQSLNIKTPTGEFIKLSQLANIQENTSSSSIKRSGNSRINVVQGNLNSGKSIDSIVQDMKLPLGYRIKIGGESENIEKSFKELLFAFALASILIYMLLSSQFQSLKLSAIMICTIPLMFIGIFPALFLFGKSFNISAFLGLVLLLGVVVDNASLYYEYLIISLNESKEISRAIIESGKIVFRPILMNNLTTILGLIPVAFEFQKGAEFQSPMAIVVIVGLLSSFVFSLFLLPILFFSILKKQKIQIIK
ncbi:MULTISPECIES: efflux RND transporter permease subunit [Leptospira]|uniref:RND transporter, hydrophobe/amphiphile efflux-1/heavy metal efflux family, permease protein n=2 Tax=Leptospira kirschneri TaxID=29507 RepID=A0A828Y257_9LEPT|nr:MULTISPECIES: efflux RND transporter permease subunit [Leptospira]EJO69859.1 RND transporter, Hydrophobe/Amphiphile Efflux-1 (HAE1)/Heavy Metal Efflux (HME) family, permease protein [Leptospira kirschneri serovar Grippotyphosa str. RM52]EKO50889.1 RND transporter, hydrophobe/amphiphile efflux-1/heavy metal efflux family, permease protein [Leptospira kirschneri str. 200802841]EKQ84451.1 RND transporter, Hydrophobe/Amphiphile Efflux-1 (HAE1)/Heavy Metal Efflux (HME) family, permease protein [Le